MRPLSSLIIGFVCLFAVPVQAATFTVNSTADPGVGVCDVAECTLREAINAANATPGTDTIAFNIPSTGPHTIQPTSALPTITDPVIIDGTTQPGFAGAPIIELDGSLAGAATNGLSITAGGSTVRGLVINRFSQNGISISLKGNNLIEGNFIGTDVTGSVDLGNGLSGVFLQFSLNNTVGGTEPGAGNLISGNISGIFLGNGATGTQVQGNFIGTDVTGTVALGNGSALVISADNNTIGGTTLDARNIISGGIGIGGQGNQVQGNFIGTDVTGTVALDSNVTGVSITGSRNTIGGTEPGAGNVI
jgi:CSLREA domain-containing protein